MTELDPSSSDGMTIDVHMHVIPTLALEALRDGYFAEALGVLVRDETVVHARGYQYPLRRAFHDLGSLNQSLAHRHIDRAILSPAPTLFGYDLPDRAGLSWTQRTNDGLADMIASSEGRHQGLGVLPMQNPAAAAKEIGRLVSEEGLLGAIIGAHIEGKPLDDEGFDVVWRKAEEVGALLFIHPYYTGAKPVLEDFYLTNLVGNPFETCLAASRLILSGKLDQFPSLRLALAHGGGFLPYQIGRFDHGYAVREELRRAQQRPSAYLRRFAYDTLTFHPQATHFLVQLVGADRVAYGSDCPFDMAGAGLDEQVEGIDLHHDEQSYLKGRTAVEFFGFRPTT